MKKLSVDRAKGAFEALIANAYGPLWDLVDDFEVNGHTIRVKDSNQYLSVIIDNRYERIGGNCTIVAHGITYNEPLDYVMTLLQK